MRNNFVRTLALVGMVGMMSTTGLVAHAAEAPQAAQTQTVKQNLNASVIARVFDAKYYAQAYPDVVAALGNDPAVLLNHYVNNGIYEGRDASATFNMSVYALANPDLVTAFGSNYQAFINHYVTSGIKENRVASADALLKQGPKAIATLAQQNDQIKSTSNITGNTFAYTAPSADPTVVGGMALEAQQAYQRALDFINGGHDVSEIGLDKAGWTNESYLKHYEAATRDIYYNPVTGTSQAYGTTVIDYSRPINGNGEKYGYEGTFVSGSGFGHTVYCANDEQTAAATERANAEAAERAALIGTVDEDGWTIIQ
ncbi:hypothetical protein CIY_03380 [Butyrivibrio fibrisolvens 16/4]|nr:hypothetical protein CIY_03380 [Butyrivibrio fibrisolvens 16/4]